MFQFTVRNKLRFDLDSKGIWEVVEQEAPLKALHSFVLMDEFNGCRRSHDINNSGIVSFRVSAKTLMLSITANGSLYADVTIYRCDAYPETIKGLVRPFALLSIGSSLWNALRSRSEFM